MTLVPCPSLVGPQPVIKNRDFVEQRIRDAETYIQDAHRLAGLQSRP